LTKLWKKHTDRIRLRNLSFQSHPAATSFGGSISPLTIWYVGVILKGLVPLSNFVRAVYSRDMSLRSKTHRIMFSALTSPLLGSANSKIVTDLGRGGNPSLISQLCFIIMYFINFLIGDHEKCVRIEGGSTSEEI
jgi:hypothetical protein